MKSDRITKLSNQPSNQGKDRYKSIRIPGSIQPHGVLIALKEPELEIVQVSKNTKEYLGIEAEKILGKPLNFLIKTETVKALENCLSSSYFEEINPLKIVDLQSKKERYFDGIVHRSDKAIVLELEPILSPEKPSFLSFHNLLKRAMVKIQTRKNTNEFLESIVREIKKITNFDRVMIYKFARSGAGEVIAEAKQQELPSYLGLHYPATDIPEEARNLYKINSIRFIPDMNYKAVELVPKENPIAKQPLDLSRSILRSVDPCCIEYHQNINAAALLVVPLIKQNKLWGLISCHHQTAKYLSYEIRTAIEFLAQIISLELIDRYSKEELEYIVKLKSLQSKFIKHLAEADNPHEALIDSQDNLLDLVGASGAAVCLQDEITLIGKTPTETQIRQTIAALDNSIAEYIFSTDSLPKLYPEAIAFKNTASGLLMLRISRIKPYYILWFRPEVIQTVTWAGNPNQAEAENLRLSPRKSFSRWVETVKLTSLPWHECELENAHFLQSAIAEIVLKKADELAELVEELKKRNQELDFFAYAASHDLKEPLRGIYNYSTFLLEDYADKLDKKGRNKLETLIRLSDRMAVSIDTLFNFSRLGKTKLKLESTDLNILLAEVLDVFKASAQGQDFEILIPRPLPTIVCDRVLFQEVLTNLLANAFKYNDKSNKWVEIGYVEDPQVEYIFYIKDNGIGIRDRHRETIFRLFKRLHSQKKYGGGTGAGLTIAKKIIERHGGKIWVESNYGNGSIFYLTLKKS